MTMEPTEQMLELGYCVWPTRIDQKLLYDLIQNKHYYDHPNRGHDRNGIYYDGYHEGVEWGNYWTDPLNDNSCVIKLRDTVDSLISSFIVEPVLYHADVSVLTPLNDLVRPHVDTPHRHKPWNNDIAQV